MLYGLDLLVSEKIHVHKVFLENTFYSVQPGVYLIVDFKFIVLGQKSHDR